MKSKKKNQNPKLSTLNSQLSTLNHAHVAASPQGESSTHHTLLQHSKVHPPHAAGWRTFGFLCSCIHFLQTGKIQMSTLRSRGVAAHRQRGYGGGGSRRRRTSQEERQRGAQLSRIIGHPTSAPLSSFLFSSFFFPFLSFLYSLLSLSNCINWHWGISVALSFCFEFCSFTRLTPLRPSWGCFWPL